MSPRRLCIVVDDFGLNDSICEAALNLVAMGRVQAIGCLVGAPAWSSWRDDLLRLDRHEVDIGLHLDLTDTPLGGRVYTLGALIAAAYMRRLDRRRVRAEIEARLDAFEHAIGRAPAFVDGHRHVHQLPIVRDELLAALARRYARDRPWLRSTQTTSRAFKPALIECLGAHALAAACARRGWRQNAHLLGVYGFDGGPARYLQRLAGWLQSAADADLLMCHPALAADPLDPIGRARATEYAVLAADAFGALLREQALMAQPMSRILPP